MKHPKKPNVVRAAGYIPFCSAMMNASAIFSLHFHLKEELSNTIIYLI
jgi:hypothetical protein